MDTPQLITIHDTHKFRLSHVAGTAHAEIGPIPDTLAGALSAVGVEIDAVAAYSCLVDFAQREGARGIAQTGWGAQDGGRNHRTMAGSRAAAATWGMAASPQRAGHRLHESKPLYPATLSVP